MIAPEPLTPSSTGLFETRADDLGDLAAQPERFNVFFPLAAAVKQRIVDVVGEAEIPEDARAFPTFRSGTRNPATGKVEVWWLWDGEGEWPVEELTDEQRDLLLRGIVNDTRLIERIVNDWSPRQRV